MRTTQFSHLERRIVEVFSFFTGHDKVSRIIQSVLGQQLKSLSLNRFMIGDFYYTIMASVQG